MYGFVYGVTGENGILIKPFWEEELVTVYGTEEQTEEMRQAVKEQDKMQTDDPIIAFYDENRMELLEEAKMDAVQE